MPEKCVENITQFSCLLGRLIIGILVKYFLFMISMDATHFIIIKNNACHISQTRISIPESLTSKK
jgi:hypothetical protein